eukprot:m.48600 g.48600  ORF g.48600 m.48600 type:complete len:177 (+) comp47757_c0_seq2:306-836(+)
MLSHQPCHTLPYPMRSFSFEPSRIPVRSPSCATWCCIREHTRSWTTEHCHLRRCLTCDFLWCSSRHKMVVHLNSEDEYDEALKFAGIIVIDFFATWCGPCKMLAPQFSTLADKYKHAHDLIRFYKLDVDEVEEVAANNDVSAMPTIMIFKGGKDIATILGADIKKIEAAVEEALKA